MGESQSAPILIVDDVSAARRVVVRLLKKIGYTDVTEAANGKGAIEALAAKQFHLIISDLHLGDMTGIELHGELAKTQLNAKTRLLLVTSDVSKEEFEAARKAGIHHYLLKPFTTETLSASINEVLQS